MEIKMTHKIKNTQEDNEPIEIPIESAMGGFSALSFLNQRKVYLFGEINSVKIQEVVQEVHTLETFDSESDISLYINSGGGFTTDCLALVDAMDACPCDIQTIVLGQACSAACVIAANGTPGKRYGGKGAQFMYHEGYGSIFDVSAKQLDYYRKLFQREEDLFTKLMSRNTGQTAKVIREVFLDVENDHYMDAKNAKDFGIIDKIIKTKRRSKPIVKPYKMRKGGLVTSRKRYGKNNNV